MEKNKLIFENCNGPVDPVPLFIKEMRNETESLLKGTITTLVTVCYLYLKVYTFFTYVTLPINIL